MLIVVKSSIRGRTMKKTKKVIIEKEEIIAKVCDKCGIEVDEFSLDNEIVSFSHTFGYGTQHDGDCISFDICAKCFFEKIKNINYTSTRIY